MLALCQHNTLAYYAFYYAVSFCKLVKKLVILVIAYKEAECCVVYTFFFFCKKVCNKVDGNITDMMHYVMIAMKLLQLKGRTE